LGGCREEIKLFLRSCNFETKANHPTTNQPTHLEHYK
jgi:hypothetical protein